jgi:hypothetical protein
MKGDHCCLLRATGVPVETESTLKNVINDLQFFEMIGLMRRFNEELAVGGISPLGGPRSLRKDWY